MRLFFSHASRDKALVNAIKKYLPEHIAAWVDENELLIGADLSVSIDRAIRSDVDFVVIFLSRDAIASEWVKREMAWAIERENGLNRTFVIPVLLEDVWSKVEPSEFQRRLYLRCFDQSEEGIKSVAHKLYNQVVKHVFASIEETEETKVELQLMLDSLQDLITKMSQDERRLLRLVWLQPGGKGLRLSEAFQRDSQYHNALRDLRDRNLIQPLERGSWEIGKHVRLTEICKALLQSERFRNKMFADGLPEWWTLSFEGRNFLTN